MLHEFMNSWVENLRPEDVTADVLACDDVVFCVMRSLEHASSGNGGGGISSRHSLYGCRVLLGFSARPESDDLVPQGRLYDSLGQLLPGAFGTDVKALYDHLATGDAYRTLVTGVHEWRICGPLEYSSVGRRAQCKVQIRGQADVPWEDCFLSLQRDVREVGEVLACSLAHEDM